MRITFIQPYYHNIWEALGIGYIISYIKANYNDNLNISFFQGYFDKDEDIIDTSISSDIVAFSCTTPTVKEAERLSKLIKEKSDPHIVMGGWHVTATKSIPRYIDQIVVGEGEKAFLNILNGNRNNIVYGSKLDFSELASPDREAIKSIRTVNLSEKMTGNRIISFNANRGCPMNCAYCSEICMTGKYNKKSNPVRSADPKKILNEILYCVDKFDINYFKFVDPTFDANEDFVSKFCDLKANHSKLKNIKWEALLHANFVNDELLYNLKKSNCNQVNVGCESGSNKILKDIRKGIKKEDIITTFQKIKQHDIKSRAFFILGMPNENMHDIKETYDLATRLQTDYIGFTILCPYPGSDFYNINTMSDIEWENTDEYSNDFWRNKRFTNKNLKRLQRFFTKKFSESLCERQAK